MTKEDIARAYDKVADLYDNYFEQDPIAEAENNVIFGSLGTKISGNSKVIDLGCGDGLFLDYIDCNYVGVDISTKMLAKVRNKFPNNDFYLKDMADTGFPNNYFDFAVSLFGSFSYLQDYEKGIQELKRILKYNGRFMIMLYSPRYKNRKSYILKKFGLASQNTQPTFWTLDKIRFHFKDFSYLKIKGLNYLVDDIFDKDDDNIALIEKILRVEQILLADKNVVPYFYVVEGGLDEDF